nr:MULTISPECIES: transposase [unclassified Bradyrhizobium]
MGLTLRCRSAKGCLRSWERECWINRESSGCEFRGARLGDRFRKLHTQIGRPMGQSIPLVCQDWANTNAGYLQLQFLDGFESMGDPDSGLMIGGAPVEDCWRCGLHC